MNLGAENESVEFKESLSQLEKGLKSLTAMLNKHGEGNVYFGVSDNGNICGMDIGKDTLMHIRDRIRTKIEPRIYATINDLEDEQGNKYIKVSAKGTDIPYSYDGRYYVRNVSADEQATNDILRKMLASSDADIIRQKEAPNQQLTFRSFFSVLSGLGLHPVDSEEFYGNYGLLNRENKYNVNAYLISDSNDISIKVVAFEGENKSVMSKRTEYGRKCLLLSISEVLEFFSALNTVKVDLSGSQRKEQPLFDFASFREAWINACLHNDWNGGIAPSVYLFDDRIEIVSYGGLPYTLSKEGFFSGTSVPVNKSLLMIFMASKYAEQSCHGVPTIVKKYGRDIFSFDNSMIKVTIPLAYERDDVTKRKNIRSNKNRLTKKQELILNFLKDNPQATLQEVASNTGLSLGGVKKICSRLQEIGVLERDGSKKDGQWITKQL